MRLIIVLGRPAYVTRGCGDCAWVLTWGANTLRLDKDLPTVLVKLIPAGLAPADWDSFVTAAIAMGVIKV